MVKITTVLVDCDGTFASSQTLWLSTGAVGRFFSTYDGEGVALLKQHGIRVAIVTQSKAIEIYNRAKWLDIECYGGISDKDDFILGMIPYQDPESICFMGNDLNDLEAMKLVGYPACPGDANGDVLNYCYNNDGFISLHKGGNGAFRELVDYLIECDSDPKFVHPPFP